ncbi:MAG: O-antigen ligase family protein [Bacteroidales bacterium]|nr:O-antigen ligase family protein [Bacteroidales bacterium]MCF8391515.1 O-antigen ligase family protein [Bacteroidales bacterium]
MNPFSTLTGSQRINAPMVIALIVLLVTIIGFFIAREGMVPALVVMVLPGLGYFLHLVFKDPRKGLIYTFTINYFILGLTRYLPGPLGLVIDVMLVLTYIAVFFRNFKLRMDLGPARKDLSLLAAIWFLYAIFQLFNPEAVSRAAWFYAMRGVSLYFFLTIPLTFLLFGRWRDLKLFFTLWSVFTLLGVAKGVIQFKFGVDPFEQRWLNEGGAITHVLFGKLRIFSFFSDAAVFGGSMGLAGLVFGLLGLTEKNPRKKAYFLFVSLSALFGMMISGTRGSIAIPSVGSVVYVILRKNVKVIVLGGILIALAFSFFKYTTIGQGNAEIRRMRSAFDPQDASFQVRVENQKKFKVYLASRPFGGGIGSCGNWGMRFSPNTFLAQTPPDGWYVSIWAEQGVVGLSLHLFILFYIVIKASYITMFKIKDEEVKNKMQPLIAGIFGIMVASYSSGLIGQMPTGIIIYMSMAFLFMSKNYEKELNTEENEKIIE